jgi:hypothetical protein
MRLILQAVRILGSKAGSLKVISIPLQARWFISHRGSSEIVSESYRVWPAPSTEELSEKFPFVLLSENFLVSNFLSRVQWDFQCFKYKTEYKSQDHKYLQMSCEKVEEEDSVEFSKKRKAAKAEQKINKKLKETMDFIEKNWKKNNGDPKAEEHEVTNHEKNSGNK